MSWKDDARFCAIYPHVLAVEGGYVWDKNDPGGATNHGIAYNYNAGILKSFGVTGPEQMRQLTRDQALEIYYRKYFVPSQADELPDTRLALAYFDHVVNAGQGEADALLGKLDPKLFFYEGDGKNVDYFWGQTLQLMLHRLWFYTRLRNWGRYGLGWFNRLIKISKALPTIGGSA